MTEHLTVVIAVPDNYTADELRMPVDQALHRYLPGAAEWEVVNGSRLPVTLPEPYREDDEDRFTTSRQS